MKTFTVDELEAYRRRLMELITRLGSCTAELECEALRPVGAAAIGEAGAGVVHEADMSSRAAGEEVALGLLGTEEHVLVEARAALARLDQGTFGNCEACGRGITRARLDALPYARLCVRCARGTEIREQP